MVLGCQEARVHPWSVEGKAGQAFRSQRVSQSRALLQESLFSRLIMSNSSRPHRL